MGVVKREHVDDEIRRVLLNRPEKLNALNKPLLDAITKEINQAEEDGIRVLIIEGEGRAFCSGADLDEEPGESVEPYQEVTRAVREFSGVVIGKLHGYAIGGGFEFTLSFDLRYAETDTVFQLTESEVGATISNGSSRLLAWIIGDGPARELIFTGRELEAAEAAELGLVSGVYSSEELEETVREVATDIVENKSPKAIRLNKQLLQQGFPIEETLEYERLVSIERRASGEELS